MTQRRPSVAHLSSFLAHIDVARKTEITYRYALLTFAEFLTPPGRTRTESATAQVVPVTNLREHTLAEFRHWLRHERKVSRRTEGTYLAAAIRYVEWLDANAYLDGDITSSRMKLILRNARGRRHSGYKTQPIKEAVPLIISYYDQMALPEHKTARSRRQCLTILRNRAIVHTLFATGMRAQEVASLRRSDCADGTSERILITGKGEKERLVMLNPEAKSAIQAYLKARDAARASAAHRRLPLSGQAEPLFIRHDREALSPISTKTVWQLVSQAARMLGLPTRISPHDFRRYIATSLLSEGMPLESVQAFLGHESIVTTRTVYAHTRSEVLDDQVKTYWTGNIPDLLRRAKRQLADRGVSSFGHVGVSGRREVHD